MRVILHQVAPEGCLHYQVGDTCLTIAIRNEKWRVAADLAGLGPVPVEEFSPYIADQTKPVPWEAKEPDWQNRFMADRAR